MLLISDLHLQPGREDITATLVHLLRHRALTHESLLVLGDLFEVWVGDDEDAPLANLVAREFRRLHDHGVQIGFLHGNRDFLLGPDYAERCGAELMTEPWLFTHRDAKIALLHGDVLCTDDVEYMKFRNMVRDPNWQKNFLARPLAERQAFARQAREQSASDTQQKSQDIMDVNHTAVQKLMTDLQLDVLIHGHTHRPATHELALPGQPGARRIVLGDWDRQGWLVDINPRGIQLEAFPLQAAGLAL